jgi:hypothetical protein
MLLANAGEVTGVKLPVHLKKSIFFLEERRLCLKRFTTSCGGRGYRAAAL